MAIRPYLLISNDDGVTAPGIQFLVEALRPYADILVMAPDSARSGFSCSITSAQPITYKVLREEEGLTVCSCSGTPTDCVKMAFESVSRLVVPTLLLEASIMGIILLSMHIIPEPWEWLSKEHCKASLPLLFRCATTVGMHTFEPLRPYLVDFMYKSLALALPPFTCLNVNFPAVSKFKGVKVCRMAYSRWTKEVEERKHPWGGKYYWLVGENIELEPEATDTDRWALAHGYVAVTPTQLDVTAKELVEVLREVL